MKFKTIIKLLLTAPVLAACQGDEISTEEPEVPVVPKKIYTVKASFPGEDQTRSHITYGNKNQKEEIFRWHPIVEDSDDNDSENDYISVFNITRLSECPYGIDLCAVEVKGNTATFQTINEANADPNITAPADLNIKAGDVLFVNYWSTERNSSTDNIFKMNVGDQKPQLIVENPEDPSYMNYMQGNLKMYDIVTAVEDDKIPDVHFRHLSAIMRITLRNETGRNFYPKELRFEATGDPFFPSYMYFSVDPEAENGSGLVIYNGLDSGGVSGAEPYTSTASVDINNYTNAPTETGTFIAPGKSYDLYMAVFPRINNEIRSETLNISLQERTGSDSSNSFDMTLEGFNTIIKAGLRYWFSITAVDEDGDYKLMFTSKWLKEHPEQNTEKGE